MATSFDKNDKLPGTTGKKAGKRGGSTSVTSSDKDKATATAKKSAPDRSRRAIADDVRRKQSRAERRKSVTIVGACVAVALIIIGAAAFNPVRDWWQQRQYSGQTLTQIGSAAGVCGKVTTKKATAAQQHVAEGTPITYTEAPPAFGQHYPVPDPINRKLYTAADRPALGNLVHNLEHGYTILWYDTTVADSTAQMNQLKAIAKKLGSSTDYRQKFKAVPWLKTDESGAAFPKGQHVAFTHWAARAPGTTPGSTDEAMGVWQYCTSVSGDGLSRFMDTYDYTNSPEPAVP